MKENISKEYLQWLQNEFEDSPFWKHMEIEFNHLDVGEVTVQMPAKMELMNSNGVLHGGAISSILDSVIGATIRSQRKVRVATISITIQYFAPVKEGKVFASAKIKKSGNKVQFVEATVRNTKREIIGVAIGTFKVSQID